MLRGAARQQLRAGPGRAGSDLSQAGTEGAGVKRRRRLGSRLQRRARGCTRIRDGPMSGDDLTAEKPPAGHGRLPEDTPPTRAGGGRVGYSGPAKRVKPDIAAKPKPILPAAQVGYAGPAKPSKPGPVRAPARGSRPRRLSGTGEEGRARGRARRSGPGRGRRDRCGRDTAGCARTVAGRPRSFRCRRFKRRAQGIEAAPQRPSSGAREDDPRRRPGPGYRPHAAHGAAVQQRESASGGHRRQRCPAARLEARNRPLLPLPLRRSPRGRRSHSAARRPGPPDHVEQERCRRGTARRQGSGSRGIRGPATCREAPGPGGAYRQAARGEGSAFHGLPGRASGAEATGPIGSGR